MLAKPAKLAKVVTYGLCELRGLGVRNTTKQFVITYKFIKEIFRRVLTIHDAARILHHIRYFCG